MSKLFCSNCGVKVDEQDRFCRSCGTSLISGQEDMLYSFGPLGVSVCFSRPGFFVWTQRNNTRIELTSRRISGWPIFYSTDSPRFQIPYNAILLTERFRYLAARVLWIQYMGVDKVREVSIMCSVFNTHHIARANELLQTHL